MTNLLKKAKEYSSENAGRNLPVLEEEVDLVLAYLQGEISTRGYAHAVGLHHPGQVTHRVSVVLRHAIHNKLVTIKRH